MANRRKFFRAQILDLPRVLAGDIYCLLRHTRFKSLKPFLLYALRKEVEQLIDKRVLVQDLTKAASIVDSTEREAAIDAAYTDFRALRMAQADFDMLEAGLEASEHPDNARLRVRAPIDWNAPVTVPNDGRSLLWEPEGGWEAQFLD